MNREQLKALGLSDEQIEQVMSMHGSAVGTLTGQVETITSERDSLQATADQYANQISELGKEAAKVPGLSEKIEEIQRTADANAATTEGIKKDYEIRLALTNSGAKSTKVLRNMLDDDKIAIDDKGNVIGITEQIDALKASDDFKFLFQEVQEPQTQVQNPSKPQITFADNSNQANASLDTVDPFEAAAQKYKRG